MSLALTTGLLSETHLPKYPPQLCRSSNSGYHSIITFLVKTSLIILHKNSTLSTPIFPNTFLDELTFH